MSLNISFTPRAGRNRNISFDKHENEMSKAIILSLALLSNKYFKNMSTDELMTLSNHSRAFVRNAVLFRVKKMLGQQNDIDKILKSKNDLMNFLNKLNANTNKNLIESSYSYVFRNFPKMIPKNQKMFPTNGSEPIYRPELWDGQLTLIKNNNCYAYALNELKLNTHTKRAPRNLAKIRGVTSEGTLRNNEVYKPNKDLFNMNAKTEKTCKKFLNDILEDLKPWGGYILKYDPKSQVCETPAKGFYRIALVLALDDFGSTRDFHFYRQNRNGFWSHKRGWYTAPIAVDANNQLIMNPHYASRDYKTLNYNKFCAFIACPNNLT
tara:strand:- start:56 stop:1024 length:969 start_codon:yes stop_codon:yes gene_type:complete